MDPAQKQHTKEAYFKRVFRHRYLFIKLLTYRHAYLYVYFLEESKSRDYLATTPFDMHGSTTGGSLLATSDEANFVYTSDGSAISPSKKMRLSESQESQPVGPARAAVADPFAEKSDYATWKFQKKGTLPIARSLNLDSCTQPEVPLRDLSSFPDMAAGSGSAEFVYTTEAGSLLEDSEVDDDSDDDILGKGKKPKPKVKIIF